MFNSIFFRYSLNDKIKPIPPPLISVDTSHSISSASENGLPAVYGVPVHSRPSSRYSHRSHSRAKRDRVQPPPQQSLQPYQSHSSSSGGSSAQYSKYSNGRMIIKWRVYKWHTYTIKLLKIQLKLYYIFRHWKHHYIKL